MLYFIRFNRRIKTSSSEYQKGDRARLIAPRDFEIADIGDSLEQFPPLSVAFSKLRPEANPLREFNRAIWKTVLASVILSLSVLTPARAESAHDESTPHPSAAMARCEEVRDAPVSSYPAIATGCGTEFSYLGAYFADGRYRTASLTSTWAQEGVTATPGTTPHLRPTDVPPFINLHPIEHTVENLHSGSGSAKRWHGKSRLAEWRDNLITAVYGHELALLTPQYVTTDSKNRVIVSDPGAGAVHVLDRRQPFRIVAGPNYRLQRPGAVAADGEDNIFVADDSVGVVQEFDSYGRFVREIGRISEDEGIFHHISGLAIGPENHLFVTDAGREMLLELDRDGRVVRRAGGRRREMGVSFQHPSALAIENNRIVVVDSEGTRVQVLDGDCDLLFSFATGISNRQMGVDVDSAGNIYLSSVSSPRVVVYGPNGEKKGEFGKRGTERGEIESAAGMWIDAADRIYVADQINRRIAVFQITKTDGSVGQ